MRHYHSGYNMPGYLPESDCAYVFASFADARDSLVDDMKRHADSEESWVDEHACDDIPCPTYGDGCGYNRACDIRASAEDLGAEEATSSDWGGYGGDLAYWVHACDEAICLDDEDRLSLSIAMHPANLTTTTKGN